VISRIACPLICPDHIFLLMMNFNSGISGLNSTGGSKILMGLRLIPEREDFVAELRRCGEDP